MPMALHPQKTRDAPDTIFDVIFEHWSCSDDGMLTSLDATGSRAASRGPGRAGSMSRDASRANTWGSEFPSTLRGKGPGPLFPSTIEFDASLCWSRVVSTFGMRGLSAAISPIRSGI